MFELIARVFQITVGVINTAFAGYELHQAIHEKSPTDQKVAKIAKASFHLLGGASLAFAGGFEAAGMQELSDHITVANNVALGLNGAAKVADIALKVIDPKTRPKDAAGWLPLCAEGIEVAIGGAILVDAGTGAFKGILSHADLDAMRAVANTNMLQGIAQAGVKIVPKIPSLVYWSLSKFPKKKIPAEIAPIIQPRVPHLEVLDDGDAIALLIDMDGAQREAYLAVFDNEIPEFAKDFEVFQTFIDPITERPIRHAVTFADSLGIWEKASLEKFLDENPGVQVPGDNKPERAKEGIVVQHQVQHLIDRQVSSAKMMLLRSIELAAQLKA